MKRLRAIGSLEKAKECAKKCIDNVPAYKKFLLDQGKTGTEPFEELPVCSKKTYITRYPYEELMPNGVGSNPLICSSSGSSMNQPFYWVYQKEILFNKEFMKLYLERIFSIHKKQTLIIVATSLGSWLGGDFASFVMKYIAFSAEYQLTQITIGPDIGELILIVAKFAKYFDQLLVIIDPTAFIHAMLQAEHEKFDFPFDKMRYVFVEEGFSEEFRMALQKKSKLPESEPVAISFYGSADTGSLGVESSASIALRKLCYKNQSFLEYMGVQPDSPLFFHLCDPNVYIGELDGDMCITKWQGVPLLRYNLKDKCYLYSWTTIQEEVKKFDFASEEERKLAALITMAPGNLPDLIAIFGRSDSSINYGGTKLFEYMFDEIIKSAELRPYLTGIYKVKISYQGPTSYIDFLVEAKEKTKEDPQTIEKIENIIEKMLCEISPEFNATYVRLSKSRTKTTDLKFVKIQMVRWPTLSKEVKTRIKFRGIDPQNQGEPP